MPICPQCSTTIHAGAEDQCPACGYSLRRANDIFGDALVEFTRVVDVAGALTHPQRLDLLRTLEDLERNIRPAALCIYITDDGQMQHLRSHAHWILNHARIHHPSFGKRELRKVIEEGVIQERRAGEEKEEPEQDVPEVQENPIARLWKSVKGYVRDAFFPYAPPVKQEWMLVLVVDVQLEMACFSWGYMLDPYVNPDSINSCIVSARLQFRERAFVPGLKKVMREAVHRIAADARRVNRRLRRQAPPAANRTSVLLAALLGLGLLSAPAQAAPERSTKPAAAQKSAAKPAEKKPAAKPATKPAAKPAEKKPAAKPATKPAAKPAEKKPAAKPAPKPAAKPVSKPAAKPTPPKPAEKPVATPIPAMDDDAVAEEIDEVTDEVDTPAAVADAPAPAAAEEKVPEPPTEACRATVSAIPAWRPQHYAALMQGELDTGYTALSPNREANKTTLPAAADAKTDESDTGVLGKYCEQYAKVSTDYLRDPQGLLTSIEQEDVQHVLRDLNAQAKFRIYLAVFKAGQEIPAELSAETLATSSLPVGEYAVLVQYPLGNAQGIELGYQLIKQEDDVRHEWLTKVREASAATGGGVEGVLAAVRQVGANVTPVSADFKPVTAENAAKAPLIKIDFRTDEKEKKVSFKDKLKKLAEEPANLPVVLVIVAFFAIVALAVVVFLLCRRSSVLLPTTPDVRLSSPYGAGVSRYVRYLEGQEAGKEKRIF